MVEDGEGPATIRLGPLERADGSAEYIIHEGNHMTAAVFGPGPVKSKQERIDAATIEVTLEALNTPPGLAQTFSAGRIRELLERLILTAMHPRSLISVTVQPIKISRPERLFVDAFNASVLALVDARIPMASIPVAVRIEEGVEAVFSHTSKDIILVYHHSLLPAGLDADRLSSLVELAKAFSTKLFTRMQKTIHESYSSQPVEADRLDSNS